MYQTNFTVAGKGTFPVDMLRYDRCFPARDSDVVRSLADGQREITLATCAPRKVGHLVTEKRWATFGWTVINQDIPRKIA